MSFAIFCVSAPAQAKEKVLLDADMVEAFDDGVAMIMLTNAPNIELVGVTTLSGNSWVEEGIAYTVKQLEIEGRADVPVAAGLEYPLRPQRHELFELEREKNGMGHDAWLGSFGLKKPASWQDVYTKQYGKLTDVRISEKHAVDFIIDTVRANPGQITIAAIGPCGNLALAVRKAPDIIPLIKRVVYMGGAFFQPGNVTPAAEFNWWFDPEAAQIAVRSPFKEQIVLGLDVCEKVVFRKEHYDRLVKTLGSSEQSKLLRSSFVGGMFEQDAVFTHYVWDVLVAAVIIDPTLITKEVTCYIDVNTDYGISYGQSLAYPKLAPKGAQQARIVLDLDQIRFWDMLNDTTYWASAYKAP
jgi:inosine-uridine nucleoside N-ribohydrolase